MTMPYPLPSHGGEEHGEAGVSNDGSGESPTAVSFETF